ncbi:MAG: iron uptake porin [Okeania sp. SIO2G4]|uniref:iron uptake porin n=1 Tax=unclassified Okeania TaxID=2634635 RepID=UPI0013B6DFA5|nr:MULTISPECIES: iron uptake porin [unclassified Okeania]NEP74365.1 iron uptake porin [Okeania sp. SIO2G5]NEP95330.1 iron uptake porin [Okeania sp. SIO2F5]NEQ93018.1 iron uptake porin [Okeania sp. SIO2G4]
MKKILKKARKYSPSILSATLFIASPTQATPPVQMAGDFRPLPMDDPSLAMPSVSELEAEEAIDQVTSVSQLSDVQPTDWAFQALQSLVERYGCIAGYPDGTFKGNRAMTRYEFAAGLNSCLDRITELIAAATSNLVTREDLAILQRLQEEFAAELAALRGRVDSLEARTAELENNQFSTTTKLNGEVLFWLNDTFGERAAARGEPSGNDKTETTFSYRVRLEFESSFTGEDLLFTRLQANNLNELSEPELTNTLMTLASIDEGDGSNDVGIDLMFYQFPIGERAQALIGPIGVDLDDVSLVLTPFADEGDGTISRFGRRNPTSFRGPANAGLGFSYAFNDKFQVNVAYLADDPANPAEGAGAFNGAYSALGQLVIEPNDRLAFTLGYVRKYWGDDGVDITNGTGSFKAQDPFDGIATTADNVGFQAHWRVNEKVEVGGWFGSTWARPETGNDDDDDVTIINGMLYFAFPDLLREGNMGGLMVGVPPIVTDGGDDDALKDDDTSIHIEAIYRFQVNDNISLTPGLFVITNPNHDDVNDTIWVSTFRTQFRF